MQESEEETEKCQSQGIESSNEPNSVVVLLRKSPSSRAHYKRPSNAIIKPAPNGKDSKILNLSNDLGREVEPEEKNEEIDFIVLEETSQEPIENSHESIENEYDETEQNSCKKMRLEIEQATHPPNESVKLDDITIRKPSARISCDVIIPRNTADGIVSSTETVDANNEETYFALSLVGILKRLPPHKRAIAKCHILSYLTELEYGSSSLS